MCSGFPASGGPTPLEAATITTAKLMYSSSKLLKRSAHSVPSRWWLRLYQIEKRCFTMVLALPKPDQVCFAV